MEEVTVIWAHNFQGQVCSGHRSPYSLSEITKWRLSPEGFLLLATLGPVDYGIWTFMNLHLDVQEGSGPHLMIGKKCGFKDYARGITRGGTGRLKGVDVQDYYYYHHLYKGRVLY